MSEDLAKPDAVATDRLLQPVGRPLLVFAHQDDETVVAGSIRRILRGGGARPTFLWWTNGDGLAPGSGMHPAAYARMRMDEATASVVALGGDPSAKVDLGASEIENYRRLTHVAAGGTLGARAVDYFLAEAERVEAAVRHADPDRVFLLAWQGGHPEHDLVHLMTVRAIRKLRLETRRPIPIVHCPAYEYVIACALRFKPWFRGDVRRVELDDDQRAAKRRSFEAYVSQRGLFEHFERVVRTLGGVSRLVGRPFTVEDYLATEVFGVVEPDHDYTASSHRFERLNYMLDDFEGIPIRFDRMIRPLARELLR
ncbi:MAG: PIG-L family deacetylase [Deltaproteobacteria bacterium]